MGKYALSALGVKLFNTRMLDGSRHFASLPEGQPWDRVRDHLSRLDGAHVTGYLTDDVTEAWIDFKYRLHKFSINNQFGEYWFFVSDPRCGDDILSEVVAHSRLLLS